MHVEETNSSLGFASRAKKISNSVKVNEVRVILVAKSALLFAFSSQQINTQARLRILCPRVSQIVDDQTQIKKLKAEIMQLKKMIATESAPENASRVEVATIVKEEVHKHAFIRSPLH